MDSANFTYNIAKPYNQSDPDLDATIEELQNSHEIEPSGTSSSSSSHSSSSSPSISSGDTPSDTSNILLSLSYSHDGDDSHQFLQACTPIFTVHEGYNIALRHDFTQMSTTKGIAKHGEKAIASISKELKQLNDIFMEGKLAVQPINFEGGNFRHIDQILLC